MDLTRWCDIAPNDTATRKFLVQIEGNTPTLSAVTLTTDVTGILPVANGGTGLASGTSGGILAYTATGTLASSGALTASALVLGGGAGVAPTPMASLGTTTTVLHGNAAGAPTFGAVSLTADVSGILPTANGGTGIAYFTAAGPTVARIYTFPDAACSIATTDTTQSISGAKTFTLAVIPTGGIAAAGGFSATARLCHTGGIPAQVSTDGTELDVVVTELYVAEVFIPANCTVTGASVFWGTNTNGNAKVCLFNSAGTRVAISASTDISGFSGDSYGTRIAFSAPYSAVGPATYYLGVICDDNTNDINTHTLGNFGAGKITGLVYATEAGYATISAPSTFTTALGPIATLY